MATAVYVLCAVTSGLCMVLLGRAYLSSRARLLLWSTWCFALLTINNVLLVVDLVLWHDGDLRVVRSACALAGVGLLLAGFILDVGREEHP